MDKHIIDDADHFNDSEVYVSFHLSITPMRTLLRYNIDTFAPQIFGLVYRVYSDTTSCEVFLKLFEDLLCAFIISFMGFV